MTNYQPDGEVQISEIAGFPRAMATGLLSAPLGAPEEAADVIGSLPAGFAERVQGPLANLNSVFDAGYTSASMTTTVAHMNPGLVAPTSTVTQSAVGSGFTEPAATTGSQSLRGNKSRSMLPGAQP